MNSFDEYVGDFLGKVAAAGLTAGPAKPIPYGCRIDVSDGAGSIPVSLYHGKKGCSLVVGGKSGALKERVEQLALGSSAPAAGQPSAAEPGKPYGFEDLTGFETGWIGTDESGKGDVFGPLVAAAVAVNPDLTALLAKAGVKDCKQLTDQKVGVLAAEIRRLCAGRFRELVVPPARYNSLYASMKSEGKNLNHLLAWAHARVIEDTLSIAPCRYAITDKFADVRYVESKLMARGRAIVLVQKPYAERNIAVAAASVLARDAFLRNLAELAARFDIELPKGAGPAVKQAIRLFAARHGNEALREVGKLHFKTFEEVL